MSFKVVIYQTVTENVQVDAADAEGIVLGDLGNLVIRDLRTVNDRDRTLAEDFHHPVRVPADAANGKAKITLSFPDWKEGSVTATILEVPIVDAKAESDKK